MALTSVFYDGVATEADRAANLAGNPSYGVGGPNDFRVTAHPTIPYAVLVKAGRAHGRKLTDTAATDEVVQCAAPANGVVRWDCIVVRRNWQPLLGGPSMLVAVSAGANPVIPATLKKNPGVEDDQPIFLVKWVGGTSAPTQFIDLRCWPAMGGAVVMDKLALGYLGEPGACVVLDNVPWQYVPVANGLWDWVNMGGTSGSSANTVMRRDASNAVAVGAVLLTATQSGDVRSATRKDYVDVAVSSARSYAASQAAAAQVNARAYALSQANSAESDAKAYAKSYTDAVTPRKIATGFVQITIGASNTFTSVAVDLPSGFAAAPRISLTITSNMGYPGTKLVPMAINRTAGKFDAKLATNDGNQLGSTYQVTLDWIAILI